MHPETVLLPLTDGIASALAIGSVLLCVIAAICVVFAVAAGRFHVRPASTWLAVILWSGLTGWTSAAYQDQYAAALAARRPAISDTEANAALLLAIHPSAWAVKTILLGLVGGFLWAGTTRARAATALLLAYSQGPQPRRRDAVPEAAA